MSIHEGDSRIVARGGGYDVRLRLDNLSGWVRPAPGGGWTATLEGVGPFRQEFPTADEAIRSLIGDPE